MIYEFVLGGCEKILQSLGGSNLCTDSKPWRFARGSLPVFASAKSILPARPWNHFRCGKDLAADNSLTDGSNRRFADVIIRESSPMIGLQSQVLRNVDLRHGKACPHAWMQKESVSHDRFRSGRPSSSRSEKHRRYLQGYWGYWRNGIFGLSIPEQIVRCSFRISANLLDVTCNVGCRPSDAFSASSTSSNGIMAMAIRGQVSSARSSFLAIHADEISHPAQRATTTCDGQGVRMGSRRGRRRRALLDDMISSAPPAEHQ